MITKITCLHDFICFFEKESFDFKPITLLVGDQGCGKSTLLHIAKDCISQEGNASLFKREIDETVQQGFLMLDFEKDNPGMLSANPNDGDDMLYKMLSKFNSHGETLLPILEHLSTVEDTVIILDEPETALSLRSQFKMIEIFKGCLERNCQIIIATHNLIFMEAFPDSIFSLEHMKYVTPEEFVELEKEENNIKEEREDKKIKKEKCTQGTSCECANEIGRYDDKCVHYIDREGKSGYDRIGSGIQQKMKKGDFKNG